MRQALAHFRHFSILFPPANLVNLSIPQNKMLFCTVFPEEHDTELEYIDAEAHFRMVRDVVPGAEHARRPPDIVKHEYTFFVNALQTSRKVAQRGFFGVVTVEIDKVGRGILC